MVSRTKKIIDTRLPIGMLENTVGNTLNTRLGPSAGSSPMENTAGKITMPIKRAMNVSNNTTYTVAAVRFSLGDR